MDYTSVKNCFTHTHTHRVFAITQRISPWHKDPLRPLPFPGLIAFTSPTRWSSSCSPTHNMQHCFILLCSSHQTTAPLSSELLVVLQDPAKWNFSEVVSKLSQSEWVPSSLGSHSIYNVRVCVCVCACVHTRHWNKHNMRAVSFNFI